MSRNEKSDDCRFELVVLCLSRNSQDCHCAEHEPLCEETLDVKWSNILFAESEGKLGNYLKAFQNNPQTYNHCTSDKQQFDAK